jgi:hypothetical protein
MINAVATANSTAKTESSRRLRCQFAMSDPPQAARADAPTIRGDPEIVSEFGYRRSRQPTKEMAPTSLRGLQRGADDVPNATTIAWFIWLGGIIDAAGNLSGLWPASLVRQPCEHCDSASEICERRSFWSARIATPHRRNGSGRRPQKTLLLHAPTRGLLIFLTH